MFPTAKTQQNCFGFTKNQCCDLSLYCPQRQNKCEAFTRNSKIPVCTQIQQWGVDQKQKTLGLSIGLAADQIKMLLFTTSVATICGLHVSNIYYTVKHKIRFLVFILLITYFYMTF